MDVFQFIRSQLNIFDVVSGYVPMKRIGNYFKSSCPFHSEKDASFTISPGKEMFFCFGCKKTGDLIGFVADIEQISQIEAVNFLCDKYDISIPAEIAAPKTPDEERQKNIYLLAHKEIAIWCENQLQIAENAKAYLRDRKIDSASILKFKIGYFPLEATKKKELLKHLLEKSVLQKDLIDFGIFPNLNQKLDTFFSPFENRIIFPIIDQVGRYVGFGGRVFLPNDERPKYYNSKEAPLFLKKKLLFGLHQARKAAATEKTLFLVEGYFDVVTMHQAGFCNVVATLGTSCGKDQLELIERFASKLFLLYDSDSAGINATLKLAEEFFETNLEVKVVTLPKNVDPAEQLNNSVADFLTAVDGASDILSYFLGSVGKEFASFSDAKKFELIKKKLNFVSKINDPLRQYLAIQKVAQITGLNVDLLKKQLLRIKKIEPFAKKTVPQKIATSSTLPAKEDSSLEAILFFNDFVRAFRKKPLLVFSDTWPLFDESWQNMFRLLAQNNWHNFSCIEDLAENFYQQVQAQSFISQQEFYQAALRADIEFKEDFNAKPFLQKLLIKFMKEKFAKKNAALMSFNSQEDRDKYQNEVTVIQKIKKLII